MFENERMKTTPTPTPTTTMTTTTKKRKAPAVVDISKEEETMEQRKKEVCEKKEEKAEEKEETTTTTTTKKKKENDTELDAKGRPKLPPPENPVVCPRCTSKDTKFCYYNNHNIKQPRFYCKGCQRYWTEGGVLRNVPVGAGRRKSSKTTGAAVTAITSMPLYKKGKSVAVNESGPKMFRELGGLGELAFIAHQAEKGEEKDGRKQDGSSDGSATEIDHYETGKKNTKKRKCNANTSIATNNKNIQQNHHEEFLKNFPGMLGGGSGGAMNFYTNLVAGMRSAPMIYPFGYGTGNNILTSGNNMFAQSQFMHQVAGASNNLETLLSPTERAWAHSVGFNGMESAVNAMSIAGLAPRNPLNLNVLNSMTVDDLLRFQQALPSLEDTQLPGANGNTDDKKNTNNTMTSAQLGSTKSGTCTAANGFKLDSDYGVDKLNVDTDASNTKAASAKKAASQSDSGNTNNDSSRDGSRTDGRTTFMHKNYQNDPAALSHPLFVQQNMCPNFAMMVPSGLDQQPNFWQQQMLMALSQMHHSQGVQMTYPQHPFQQGFVQEHQHNQEEQPVPPHSTAATTSAPITIDKNANTTVEEKDGKMIVNDKRRAPIRRDDTARALGGRMTPKKSVPP